MNGGSFELSGSIEMSAEFFAPEEQHVYSPVRHNDSAPAERHVSA